MRYTKDAISISVIGKSRFWIGISVGIISAVSLSLYIDYSRESLRIFSFMSGDLLILPEKQVVFFDYFFSAFSTVFGLGLTLWVWLGNYSHKSAKVRIFTRLAQLNIFLTIWVFLMFIARWGTIIPIVLYSQRGYDNQLDLYNDAWFLFVLIPLILFLNSWHTVRLVYKSSKWILFSFVSVLIITTLLANTKTVNRDIIPKSFKHRNEYKYKYIEDEIKKALSFNITINKETQRILRQNYTESAINQVADVQKAFCKGKKVNLDTLVLEKIIAHNYKIKHNGYYSRDETYKNWSYAYPEQIYEQLKMYDKDCIQVKYLFEILNEISMPFSIKDIDYKNYKEYSIDYIRMFQQKQSLKHSTKTILSRLRQVIDKLKQEDQYEKYYYLLQNIDINTFGKQNRKKNIALNLDSIENIYVQK